MAEIKALKKRQFADYVFSRTGERIDPDTLFDVHAKRLHEYKRQLMNAMNIISHYTELKDKPNLNVQPKTYIFAAKAAPGYYMAKEIIKLICFIAEDVKKHPALREKLNVVYLEDYGVTMAEKLMPATEISEQISTAGKEASGTGNMKFMINGAVTVGTLDGANVEMLEAVGDENIFIFGLTAKEVDGLWKRGYNSTAYYNNNVKLQRVADALKKGFNGESFENLANYLLTASPIADPYMCMADFGAYQEVKARADEAYADVLRWQKMSLKNVAESGRFSADRAIKEYAENIWNLRSVR